MQDAYLGAAGYSNFLRNCSYGKVVYGTVQVKCFGSRSCSILSDYLWRDVIRLQTYLGMVQQQ